MCAVRIEIRGEPAAKLRHRDGIGPQGGRRAYTPAATKQWEKQVAWQAQATGGGNGWPWTGPVEMDLELALAGRGGGGRRPADDAGEKPHVAAPDVTNLAKAIEDALNGVAYSDDRQICRLTARKVCRAEGHAVAKLRQLDPESGVEIPKTQEDGGAPGARLWIGGHPVSKLRHRRGRVRTRAGQVRTVQYTPERTKKWERQVAWEGLCLKAEQGWPWTGPIRMRLDFVLPIAPSLAKNKQAERDGAPHQAAPDLANLAKAVEDGLSGVAYADDRQVYWLEATKRYGRTAGVQVELWHHDQGSPGAQGG